VTAFHIFIIRAILGGAIAVVLIRIFHPGSSPFYAIALALFLVVMAYLLEHAKSKK
jgi:hypothetical protein